MKLDIHTLTLPIATFACLLLSSPTAGAQDSDKPDPNAEAAAAAMEAYMKSITPGPEHKQMESMVGKWKTEQTMWMAPGAPEAKSAGTAEFRMLMGGRFLEQDYVSEIAGMGPFKGRGTTAFDNATKEYVNTWFDSFGTGIMVSRGKANKKDSKTVSVKGKMTDALSGKKVGYRIVSKYVSDDHHEMEMYEKHEDADERKIMKIIYTRDKGAGEKKKDK